MRLVNYYSLNESNLPMKDSFTINDFILFSNDSGSDNDGGMVEEFLNNWEGSLASPDKRIVRNILSYSQALSVIETKQAGIINLLLN